MDEVHTNYGFVVVYVYIKTKAQEKEGLYPCSVHKLLQNFRVMSSYIYDRHEKRRGHADTVRGNFDGLRKF